MTHSTFVIILRWAGLEAVLEFNLGQGSGALTIMVEYRDRLYIRKDVLLKLFEYGELNQSRLLSFCGLNNFRHKGILDEMAAKRLIIRTDEARGNMTVIKYKISETGRTILREIFERYEELFPRSDEKDE
jgi:predicted transcriptional regulator